MDIKIEGAMVMGKLLFSASNIQKLLCKSTSTNHFGQFNLLS